MPQTIFIETDSLPREASAYGRFVEILNDRLAGAKNVVGTLRWLDSGAVFTADTDDTHQLLYLMEGHGSIRLENQSHDVREGMGVYLGPSEHATIQAASDTTIKLLHLVVPPIPTQV